MPKPCIKEDKALFVKTNRFFNYSTNMDKVTPEYYDVEQLASDKSDELASAASVMIVVFIFLIILGILGLIVEKTSLGNKPNLKSEEDEEEETYWDKYFGQEGFSADDEHNENKMSDEYHKFCQAEGKLIMSKTLWGILLLSFSFGRNARRLFQFSVIKRQHVKTTLVQGFRVMFLFWVIVGNTLLYSFYAYPANFHKKLDIAQNYVFITLFNNEFAFDTLLFFTALLITYDLIEKFDERVITTCSYILHVLNYIIKMLFPIIIIIGVAAVFPLFSSGPLWSVMTSEITATCDRYLWTHIIFISNLYPFNNNIGGDGCLPWLWFVSTEFQFFFICLALTLLYKNKGAVALF